MVSVLTHKGPLPPGLSPVSEVRRSGVHLGMNWAVVSGVKNLPNCNGYLRLPINHPRRKDADIFCNYEAFDDLEAHGGITYVRDGWIGFDTAHVGDCWPHMEFHGMLCITCRPEPRKKRVEHKTLWDEALVVEHVFDLCQRLSLEML